MFSSGNATPFTMPVAPAGYGAGNMGGWGDDWIALAIIAMIFGGNGWGGFGGGWGGGLGLGMMEMFLPFMFGFGGFGNGWGGNGNSNAIQADIQRGFDNQSVMNKLNGLENGLCDGFYAVNTSLLNGFNGVQRDLCTGFNGVNQTINQARFENQQCLKTVGTCAA